jgi:hypothetical protein
MKKIFWGIIFFITLLSPVSAQFYFDVGGGLGAGRKEIIDLNTKVNLQGGNIEEIIDNSIYGFGIAFGLRAGYGPFGKAPFYAVFEGGFDWNFAEPLTANIFFGAGTIFYPIRLIQIGASFGVSLMPSALYDYYEYPSYEGPRDISAKPGLAWNISAAVDLGKYKAGLLIGIKYSNANNPLEFASSEDFVSTEENIGTLQSHSFTIFVKFSRKEKIPQQTLADNVATETRPQENTPSQPPRQPRSNTGIDGAIFRASQDIINDLPENTSLAVINISSNDGNLSTLAVDELEFQLVSSRKFTIVNRSALDAIRREQNFQTSGEVSDASAVTIGQMLGANIVITGSITETERNRRLIIRALDVRTAQIITMVREDF